MLKFSYPSESEVGHPAASGAESVGTDVEQRIGGMRHAVEARFRVFFDDVDPTLRQRSPEVIPILTEIRDLTLRGGKRLRSAFIVAAHHCSASPELTPALVDLCAGVELLQTYLLIHDDWMDGDRLRRGAPTVHVALTRRFGRAHVGAAGAVLAGNLACTFAHGLLSTAAPLAQVLGHFVDMQYDACCGQLMDLTGSEDLERMYELKTGSYTVRGPLALGHTLAEGDIRAWSALEAYARPLGLAFQMRDDLLGCVGKEPITGKSGTSDIESGRITMPIAIALQRLDASRSDRLRALLRRAEPEGAAEVRALLHRTKAVETVEERITALRQQALSAIATAPLLPAGRQMVTALAYTTTEREA